MCDMFDYSGTSQPSDEGPETPNFVDSRICSAIHHDLSVVKDLLRCGNLAVQCMFHKVLLAHRAGLIDLSWVRDDSINIVGDVTALRQHTSHLLGALVQVAQFSLGNGNSRGPHDSVDNNAWLQGDSITVDNAETRVYENADFLGFPTDSMQNIFMAILSHGPRGAFVSTGDLARWVGYSDEHVRLLAQKLLRSQMIEGSDNDMWRRL